jgi:hypothetical protein
MQIDRAEGRRLSVGTVLRGGREQKILPTNKIHSLVNVNCCTLTVILKAIGWGQVIEHFPTHCPFPHHSTHGGKIPTRKWP